MSKAGVQKRTLLTWAGDVVKEIPDFASRNAFNLLLGGGAAAAAWYFGGANPVIALLDPYATTIGLPLSNLPSQLVVTAIEGGLAATAVKATSWTYSRVRLASKLEKDNKSLQQNLEAALQEKEDEVDEEARVVSDLEAREAVLTEAKATFAKDKKRFATAKGQLTKDQKALKEALEVLSSDRKQLDAEKEELAKEKKAFAAKSSKANKAQATKEQKLKELEASLDEREVELDAFAEELAAKQAEAVIQDPVSVDADVELDHEEESSSSSELYDSGSKYTPALDGQKQRSAADRQASAKNISDPEQRSVHKLH